MKKAVVVYHRVDTDGVLSFEIARRKLSESGYQVTPLGYNYGDEDIRIPEYTDLCVLVDISFKEDMMLALKDIYGQNFVWIDHHLTAIEASQNSGYSEVPGLRRIGTAACELTWEYFYPDLVCPEIVQYCGAYDVWNKSRFPWDDVLDVQYGFRNRYGTLIDKISSDFDSMINPGNNTVESLKEEGSIILRYLNRKWSSDVKNYAFEVLVGGKYKGICILGTEFSSNTFSSVMKDYDIYIVVNRKDRDRYNISMYKEPDRLLEFSCGGYGGFIFGHKSAAGGILTFEQFTRLITDCKI